MIGILCEDSEKDIVREFFELFKTPWEFCAQDCSYEIVISTRDEIPDINSGVVVVYGSEEKNFDSAENIAACSRHKNVSVDFDGIQLPINGDVLSFQGPEKSLIKIAKSGRAAGLKIDGKQRKIVRVGYDLFQEVAFLLSAGQPVENAHIPTPEIHISLLRNWILDAGVPLVEIPPAPPNHDFVACLTHDVDFVGIRKHRFDHSMFGFVYRALVGSLSGAWKGRIPRARVTTNWKAVLSLPFVYWGVCEDFWLQFDEYLEIERNLKSTFFLVPFKNKAGEKITSPNPKRKATKYDITDIEGWAKKLTGLGYEVGVHGIDAWHSSEKGREELERVADAVGKSRVGIRMHWLCFDNDSPAILEKAGYDYDSTCGYNETVGYRAGTTQVFSPLGARGLLELPFHVQDTALFRGGRLGLTEAEAWGVCEDLLNNVSAHGGVMTILWHLRSLAPEEIMGRFLCPTIGRTQGA